MALSPFIKRRQQQRKKKTLDREKGMNEKNPLKKIEATVRKNDEEKVENCTEDVDALLVFAGLYSAVLTAFLVESYKNLSADESENLLRQIAFQTANYSFKNGHLNTTFHTSQLPTFQAAVSDVRVNVCWFASLILSLSSASFGIAVKQWLREYLSIDCIDPLERLRIRHARFQGLQDWKLFQIAAFLPVLLQISLALFFVGLCFFTAAVHRSIGITSLLLISCWAFFFFMSVIAPLFSSRCPYKTTLLKVPFRYARPYIQSFPQRILRPFSVFLAFLRKEYTMRTERSVVVIPTKTQCPVKAFEWYDDYMDLGIVHKVSSGAFRKDLIRGEEDVLRNADDNDIIIFCDVDAVFLDDRLLDSMRRTLGHRLYPLADAFQYVTAVIQRRSGFTLAEAASGNIEKRQPWPWTLSYPLRTALVDMLVESMEHELLRESYMDWQQWDWSGSFVVLVSLVSPHHVTLNSVIRLFEKLNEFKSKHGLDIEHTPFSAFSHTIRALARTDPDWPARSLLFLAQALKTLKPEDAEQWVRYVVHTSFVDPSRPPTNNTYRRFLKHNPDDSDGDVIAPTIQTIAVLLEASRIILHNYTLKQTQDLDDFPEWTSILVEFMFDAVPRVKYGVPVFNQPFSAASDGPGLRQLMIDLFIMPLTTRAFLSFLAAHLRLLPAPISYSDQSLLLRWIFTDDVPSRDIAIAVLNSRTTFFESHPALNSPAILLRFFHLAYRYDTYEDDAVDACWRKLFTVVHSRYRRYERILHESGDKCPFDIGQLNRECFDVGQQHMDTCEVAYSILCGCDDSSRHHRVPNEMVDFLRRFMCVRHNAMKFSYFPDLDNTGMWQPEAAALEVSHDIHANEQKAVLSDAISAPLAVAGCTHMVPAPADSPDDQLDSDRRHASASEDSVPINLVRADDAASCDAALSQALQPSILKPTDTESGGCDAAEPSQYPNLAHTADTDLQDCTGVENIESGIPGSLSVRLQENAASAPSKSIETFPIGIVTAVTNDILPGGSLAASLASQL